MPWIDEEMKAAVAERLRAVHGFEGVKIGRIHVDLGPDATRENIIEQLADSMAELERRRQEGSLKSEPPRSLQATQDIREWIAERTQSANKGTVK